MKVFGRIKRFFKQVLVTIDHLDWKSKLIDLLIVIIGITLAFRLNSWSESKKQHTLIENYVTSFNLENQSNIEDLEQVLKLSVSQLSIMDTLTLLMRKEIYSDGRLKLMTPSLLKSVKYRPSTITMENVKESGDFELIKGYQLRRKIITAYESLDNLKEQESVLNDYVRDLVRPYFFEKIRYRDFYPVDDVNFVKDHRFENMIIGYGILIKTQMEAYTDTMSKLQDLRKELDALVR